MKRWRLKKNVGKDLLLRKEKVKRVRKRHQEKKKERDRGSSKSNSDVEELEKEQARKVNVAKGMRMIGVEQKFGSEFSKAQNTESGHGFKGANANNHNRGNTELGTLTV